MERKRSEIINDLKKQNINITNREFNTYVFYFDCLYKAKGKKELYSLLYPEKDVFKLFIEFIIFCNKLKKERYDN
jgi:hypothetical protein